MAIWKKKTMGCDKAFAHCFFWWRLVSHLCPLQFSSDGWLRLWGLPSHGPPAGFEIEGVMKEERCCIRTTLISRILYWHSMTSSPGFLGNSQETYNRSASIVLRMWASGLTNPNIATWKVIAHFVTQGWLSPSIQTVISFGQVSTSFEMTLHYHREL